jgi:5-(carboxyamino)imidazole ribonucleotide synthase
VTLVACIGGGQLGRMLGLAGLPLGLSFRFLDPSPDACAREVGELVVAPYDDRDALDRLAVGAAVVTYEFENVPVSSAERLAGRTRVFPPPRALEVSQDRVTEKRFLESVGVPVPPWRPIGSRDELARAVAHLGCPAVLKTRRLGYDG